jgi:hypothetical protein
LGAVVPDHAKLSPESLNTASASNNAIVRVATFAHDAVVYPATWHLDQSAGGYGVEWTAQSGNNAWISVCVE